jgi:hypothetical protein
MEIMCRFEVKFFNPLKEKQSHLRVSGGVAQFLNDVKQKILEARKNPEMFLRSEVSLFGERMKTIDGYQTPLLNEEFQSVERNPSSALVLKKWITQSSLFGKRFSLLLIYQY